MMQPALLLALLAFLQNATLHKVPDNGLAKTPPMGWDGGSKFKDQIDDPAVRAAADALVANGMKEAGYVYVNIGDSWQGERGADGNITSNKRFPDMKALAEYVHGKGMKLALTSSPGPKTCQGFEGSHGHEEQDAKTWAAWGVDYLQYEWCSARTIYSNEDMPAVYQKMADAVRASGRPIVYGIGQYGRGEVWKWGADAGGNLWRTAVDIQDTWDSLAKIGFGQFNLAGYARTGHWNDPGVLEIGNGGMNENEYRVQMALWAMLSAPLIAGSDVRSLSPDALAMLTNPEIIAIDQDSAGRQATRLTSNGQQEIWAKDLADGAKAIGFFNRASQAALVQVRWSDVGIPGKPHVRDVWARRNDPARVQDFSAFVPAHGVILLKVTR
jgi:alpha-galactosidase